MRELNFAPSTKVLHAKAVTADVVVTALASGAGWPRSRPAPETIFSAQLDCAD